MRENLFTVAMDFDVNGNPIYVGKAFGGASKASALWQIQKLVYDVNGNPTDVQWADGNTAFDNIWNNRTTYTYS